MGNIFVFLAILGTLIFIACDAPHSRPIQDTQQICKEEGKSFKIAQRLNYRTGKYEEMGVCF